MRADASRSRWKEGGIHSCQPDCTPGSSTYPPVSILLIPMTLLSSSPSDGSSRCEEGPKEGRLDTPGRRSSCLFLLTSIASRHRPHNSYQCVCVPRPLSPCLFAILVTQIGLHNCHCCCPANVRPKALRTSIRAAQSIWPNMGLQSAATRASLITSQGQEPGVADVSIRISTHPSTHLMVNASCMQAAGLDQ